MKKALRNKRDQKNLRNYVMVLPHEDCTRPYAAPQRKDGKRITRPEWNFLIRVSTGKRNSKNRRYWADPYWLEEHLDWWLQEDIPGYSEEK